MHIIIVHVRIGTCTICTVYIRISPRIFLYIWCVRICACMLVSMNMYHKCMHGHTVSGVLHCAAVSCSIAWTCCASTSVPASQWLSVSRSLMPSAMDLPLELVLCRLLAGVTCTKQARTCSMHNFIWMHVYVCIHMFMYMYMCIQRHMRAYPGKPVCIIIMYVEIYTNNYYTWKYYCESSNRLICFKFICTLGWHTIRCINVVA